MPIVLAKPEIKLEKIRLKIPADLLAEIKEYCETFSIQNLEDFFLQAAQHVLKTDRDWAKINRKKVGEKIT